MTDDTSELLASWVGYLAMTMGAAHDAINRGNSERAAAMLDEALKELTESDAVSSEQLREIRAEWTPD